MLRGRVDLESLFLIIGVINRAFNCFCQHQRKYYIREICLWGVGVKIAAEIGCDLVNMSHNCGTPFASFTIIYQDFHHNAI